ncbi:hypothetical protein AMECASPLE_021906 [Ameca splendens]|uniref:Uncharacterized protein n=1 Tax=Ameca splendens TaxID=208324 RepID=A0ABV0XT01_9TELE
MHTHTKTNTHGQQHRRKSKCNRWGKLLLLSLFLPFLTLSPCNLFFNKRTSCKTEKICKPWSCKSEFSQWEHSMIPAGLSRRVNTFFFQARNTLAEEGKMGRAPGKGRSKDGRRDREMKSTDKLSWLGVRSSFS